MSIAGITSTALPNLAPASTGPALTVRRTEAEALNQALRSGDLAGAESAFNILAGLGQNNSGPFNNPRLASDFAAVGTALQAGDLTGAQSAFATLQQDIQTTIRNHHVQSFAGPEIIINLGNTNGVASTGSSTAGSTASGDASAVNGSASTTGGNAGSGIVLNLGNANVGSAGSEITLNLGGGNGSGTNPSEIVLNLGNGGGSGNSASEVVLNFGSAASNAQPVAGALEINFIA